MNIYSVMEINVTYHFTQGIMCLPALKFDCLGKSEEMSGAAEYVSKLVSVLIQLQNFLVSSDLDLVLNNQYSQGFHYTLT